MIPQTKFDYIIVGGGSAGCVLAARLSESPDVSVCLIEAGGEGKNLSIRMPVGIAWTISGYLKKYNWAFETIPQKGLNGRKGYQPRGKGLGGSSAINASLYVRGHYSDYDHWATLGCDGWAYKDVLPYFTKSETNSAFANDFHGNSGELQVCDQVAPNAASRDFVRAVQACGHPESADFNGSNQHGAGLYQLTQFFKGRRQGERCSSAAAFLHPVMDRSNLTVITKARVTKINISDGIATGVVYKKSNRLFEITAGDEVILCAGSLQSPQLLMLSGIGPAEELEEHGIVVHKDLSGVGENLQDHVNVSIGYRSKAKGLIGIGFPSVILAAKGLLDWIRVGKVGALSTPFSEAGAFLKSDPAMSRPDWQLHFTICMEEDHGRRLPLGYGYSFYIGILRPHSVGKVSLSSAHPCEPPVIDPKFLEDERDLDLLVKACKHVVEKINQAAPLAKHGGKPLRIADIKTDEQWREYITNRADTLYHPVGTCKMGIDTMAVVDPQLRVYGIKGLRVADASIMPKIIGGNTNATTIMIGEKAADMILAARLE
jgi:choline dehydrogenase-like flavoprotein